jgi:hypothetical protein
MTIGDVAPSADSSHDSAENQLDADATVAADATIAADATDASAHDAYSEGAPNTIFITSRTFSTADFGGIGGADTECQQVASDAGLQGTFIAYLSTVDASAQSRLGSARGWARTDGMPVADDALSLSQGHLWYPITLDEHGKPLGAPLEVYTGTSSVGATAYVLDAASTCNDWTTADPGLRATQGTWTSGCSDFENFFYSPCTSQGRLLCLQVDSAVPIAPPSATGRYAFVTTSAFDPSSGLSAADALCRNEANGKLPGTYQALLATSTASAASRFAFDGGIWVRPDHVPIVATASDLASDKFIAPIGLTSSGSYACEHFAWGGAASIGAPGDGGTCGDWNSNAGKGSGGLVGLISNSGLGPNFGYNGAACSLSSNWGLYCLQE